MQSLALLLIASSVLTLCSSAPVEKQTFDLAEELAEAEAQDRAMQMLQAIEQGSMDGLGKELITTVFKTLLNKIGNSASAQQGFRRPVSPFPNRVEEERKAVLQKASTQTAHTPIDDMARKEGFLTMLPILTSVIGGMMKGNSDVAREEDFSSVLLPILTSVIE